MIADYAKRLYLGLALSNFVPLSLFYQLYLHIFILIVGLNKLYKAINHSKLTLNKLCIIYTYIYVETKRVQVQ